VPLLLRLCTPRPCAPAPHTAAIYIRLNQPHNLTKLILSRIVLLLAAADPVAAQREYERQLDAPGFATSTEAGAAEDLLGTYSEWRAERGGQIHGGSCSGGRTAACQTDGHETDPQEQRGTRGVETHTQSVRLHVSARVCDSRRMCVCPLPSPPTPFPTHPNLLPPSPFPAPRLPPTHTLSLSPSACLLVLPSQAR